MSRLKCHKILVDQIEWLPYRRLAILQGPEPRRKRLDRRKSPKGDVTTVSSSSNYLFVAVILAGFMTTGQAAEQPRTAKSQPPGTFIVQVSNDKLSLNANQAPLAQIFQEIGKQAKITFDSNIGLEEKITIQLDQVPLEEGIKQLAKNATVFYAENPKDKTRRITRVVVLAEGSGVSGQPRMSSQPEKLSEPAPQATTIKKPAPQPEPFKFEFDPGKFAKEKPGKQP
jgi:hypothetical protein